MKNTYYKRVNIISAIVVIVVLTVTFACSVQIYKNLDFSFYNNNIRVEINAHRNKLEQGSYVKCKYKYMVFDLKGIVLYADKEWDKSVGDTVIVEEQLQTDRSFKSEYNMYYKSSFVLNDRDGKCSGFVVYLIPKKAADGNKCILGMLRVLSPAAFGIFISIIIVILKTIVINKRILEPLNKISESAKAIIEGNYDIEVQRVFGENLRDNEIGELTYSFEMMRDELKAKQLSEQSLRKSQQELISCISHDLRTPISTIKAYSEGIRDGVIMEGMDNADYINIILKKTNLLEKMIAELLEYSNTQLNKMDIVMKDVYFREYMLEIVREIRIYVSQYGLDFESEIMDETMLVRMDEKRITEVIYNLIENSLKYSDKDNGFIKLCARIDSGVASIHIIDNGAGISAADIPYVFDRFYRAEKSRNSNIPGSGLGLSICKYIVNQHGGEIYCRSSKSEGSEFWFTLNDGN